MDPTKKFWLTYKVITPIMWIIGILIIYTIRPEHLGVVISIGITVGIMLSFSVNYLLTLAIMICANLIAGWDGLWTTTTLIILLTWTSYPLNISKQIRNNPYYLRPRNQTIHEFLDQHGTPLQQLSAKYVDDYWNFVGGTQYKNCLPIVLISDGFLWRAFVAPSRQVLHGIFHTNNYLRWSENGSKPQVTPSQEKPRTFLEAPQVFMVDKKMIQPLVKIKLS